MKTCSMMLLMKHFCFSIDILHICFLVCELKINFWWSLSVPGDVSLNPNDFFLLDFKYVFKGTCTYIYIYIYRQQCVGCEGISMGSCFITLRRRDCNTFVLCSSTRLNFVWVDRCLQLSKGCYLDLLYYFSMYTHINFPYSSNQIALFI